MTPPAGPDHRGDGDGWVECDLGHRHWGRYGAAGLLAHRHGDVGVELLLQHRAEWSHHGGTWGLLGGARASTESPAESALREAAEEGGVDPSLVRVDAGYVDDHGGWSYATVLATAAPELVAQPTGGESTDVAWVPLPGLRSLPLHPGFAETWPLLTEALAPLTVVVDVANVMGSRPDGWWRDRAGAARRTIARSALLARRGIAVEELPPGLALPPLHRWWPRVHLVVEGAARPAAADVPAGVDVSAAPGSGDDAIVDVVASVAAGPVLVVTADRGLRDRCAAAGAGVVGPGWWLRLLDDADGTGP